MRKNRNIYSIIKKINASLLLLAVISLTISTPVAFFTQEFSENTPEQNTPHPIDDSEDGASNLLNSNTNEEDAPANDNSIEKFVHNPSEFETNHIQKVSYFETNKVKLYHAYHGELLVPPPNCNA
ncbi:MAG: hypothetical protein CK547_04250 [Chitinophagaceae bacterium]|nr:MAG: hypothetical protein CK547_04250 [Chitinophagaceae bacterium]